MKRVIPLFLTLILLSGCWDRQEIEEIGFVMGVGLDPADENMFESTFQIAIPGQLVRQPSTNSSNTEPFLNVSTIGKTNFKNVRQIASMRSRTLNFNHLKIIVINTELLELGLIKQLSDFFIRDHEMRRKTLILASNDPVKELLQNKLPLENYKAMSIEMIQNNYRRVSSMPKMMSVGDISRYISKDTGYIMPLISSLDDKYLVIEGGAVINGKDKLVGLLKPTEIEAYNWVIGETNQSITEVNTEDDEIFVYESQKMASYISYERKNDENIFNITIKTEGSVGESWLNQNHLSDNKVLIKIQKLIEQKIEEDATEIVKTMQDEYSTDVFGFGEIIKSKKHKYWDEIKDNWEGEDSYFSKAKVVINAEVQVRHYMTTE